MTIVEWQRVAIIGVSASAAVFLGACLWLVVGLWGGKTSRERRSAMLTVCSNFSGSCSQPCEPRRAHTRIWCSRTCSYAINSRCSPVRPEADRMPASHLGQAALGPGSPLLCRLA